MRRFKLLDLFSGAGGAGVGYFRAGFDVTGVDKYPMPRYPSNEFMRFVQDDALAYALAHGHEYDAIHASPPCQTHSNITPDKSRHEDLIPHTRYVLQSLGLPYIIENVYGAKKSLINPVMLCGADFGLKVYRHRLFESNIMLLVPPHVPHRDNTPRAGRGVSDKGYISVAGNMGIKLKINTNPNARQRGGTYGMTANGFVTVSGHISGVDYCRMAMGIDWMTGKELVQAIPPAFTEYLGKQLKRHIENTHTQPEA